MPATSSSTSSAALSSVQAIDVMVHSRAAGTDDDVVEQKTRPPLDDDAGTLCKISGFDIFGRKFQKCF
jgi:hypothetical protein